MNSDTAHPEDHRDFQDGTAAIHPVTDAMMDHAAHEAAALADGVAHGTPAPEPVADAVDRAVEAMGEVSRPAVHAAEDAVDSAVEVAGRTADAAAESASASADVVGQYNAKVFEIVRANMAAASAHMAALVQAKSIPEAVSLNADHIRRQIETLTSQSRELTTLAQQAAFEAFRPFRDAAKREPRR